MENFKSYYITIGGKKFDVSPDEWADLYMSARTRSSVSWVKKGILYIEVVGNISDVCKVVFSDEIDLMPPQDE